MPLLLGGSYQAVACFRGAAGFDADGAGVLIAVILVPGQQAVGVVEHPGLGLVGGGDGILACGDDLPEGGMRHGLLGHFVDVLGGGVVIRVVQAVGVGKVGVLHPQLCGPLVHLLHEGGNIPGNGNGQGVGSLVGGGKKQAVEQILHGDFFPCHQVGGGGVLSNIRESLRRDGDHGVQAQLPPAHGLQGEQGGHDFGDAGGVAGFVGALLQQNLIGVQIHQQGGGGIHRNGFNPFVLHCPGQRGEQAGQQAQGQAERNGANQRFFHRKHPHPVL